MATNRDNIKRNAVAQAKRKSSPKEYFKGIKLEMSKVVWPTRKELVSFTGVVIAACVFFALGFWAVDSAVLAALKAILGVSVN